MNILPKKSWHVRTKRNIERVRKDEEKAAEEEKERQRRVALAEQEARTELLRARACTHFHVTGDDPEAKSPQQEDSPTEPLGTDSSLEEGPALEKPKHVNFFQDIELGLWKEGKNAEHIAEKQAEKKKWEQNIGLLTYLGQSSVEKQETPPWYLDKGQKQDKLRTSREQKRQAVMDPLVEMQQHLKKKKTDSDKAEGKGSRHKLNETRKTKTTVAKKTIEDLRAERLQRECAERRRAELLVGGGRNTAPVTPQGESSDRSRRYNSQFNPELARKRRF